MVNVRMRCGKRISEETLCPFFYKTSTIRHVPRAARFFSSTPLSCEQGDVIRKIETPHREKNEEKGFNLFRLKAQSSETARGRPKESTLTPDERKAFENIRKTFGADLEALAGYVPPKSNRKARRKATSSSTVSEAPTVNLYDTDINNILSLFAPAPSADTISGTAQDDLDRDQADTTSASTTYPPHLTRAATLEALARIANRLSFTETVIEKGTDHSYDSSALAKDTFLQQRLWHVALEVVFPLITFLRETPRSNENRSQRWHRIQQLKLGDLDASVNPTLFGSGAPLELAPKTPLLPLVTILYPAASLLVLRMFAKYAPTSGYLLALLPKIRELGPMSYLLAGNVHFYNTLLRIEWDAYSNLSGIDILLQEMRRDGVSFDRGTLQLLAGIRGDRNNDLYTEKQELERGKMWWQMGAHEVESKKITGYWRGELMVELKKKQEL